MSSPQLRDIKRAQKEANMMREVSNLILKISLDEPALQGLYVSRIKLSADGGICTVYFTESQGKESFEKKLGTLILYKPSIRSALAKSMDKRYTPDLIFKFDDLAEKQQKMEELLNRISTDSSEHKMSSHENSSENDE